MARYVLAEDYIRALRGKALIAREVDRALDGVDALVLPALAIPAPPLGAVTMPVKGGPDQVRTLMLRCTSHSTCRDIRRSRFRAAARAMACRSDCSWSGTRAARRRSCRPRSRRRRRSQFVIRDYFHRWEQELAAVSTARAQGQALRVGRRLDRSGSEIADRDCPIPDPDHGRGVGRSRHAEQRRVLHARADPIHLHESAGHRPRQRRRGRADVRERIHDAAREEQHRRRALLSRQSRSANSEAGIGRGARWSCSRSGTRTRKATSASASCSRSSASPRSASAFPITTRACRPS